jgi:N-acetylmuramoyl-L-alanine amidase
VPRFNISILLTLMLSLALHGCAGGRHPSTAATAENSLQTICKNRGIEWQWDSISQIFAFSAGGKPTKVLVGSNLVIRGGERIILSSTVERKDNMIVVPPDFTEKVLGSLSAPSGGPAAVVSLGKCREIMIDAGHGGKDPGAKGLSNSIEKDIVFDIANRLKSGLEKIGYKVTMTRDTDDFISLQRRTELASASKADLFVSIHANSTASRKIQGLEIFYSRELDHEADLTQRQANEKAFLRRLNMNNDSLVVGKIVKDMMYANKQTESVMLADHIIEGTSKAVDTPDRGGRPSGFFVVKNTLIPAVLFEVGYLTNPVEAKLLTTEEYRQKVADAIAAGIVAYSNES